MTEEEMINERKSLLKLLYVATLVLSLSATAFTFSVYKLGTNVYKIEKISRDIKTTIRQYCGSVAGKILKRIIK